MNQFHHSHLLYLHSLPYHICFLFRLSQVCLGTTFWHVTLILWKMIELVAMIKVRHSSSTSKVGIIFLENQLTCVLLHITTATATFSMYVYCIAYLLELNRSKNKITQTHFTYIKVYEQYLEWDSRFHPVSSRLLLILNLVLTNNMEEFFSIWTNLIG